MWKKFIDLSTSTKILIVITVLLLLYGIVLYFTTTSEEKEEEYGNVINKNNVVELFFSPACGHCIKFKPEWNKLISTNACIFKEYNCQNGECPTDIKHVPTLKINGKIYDGEMNYETIIPHIQ
jgi:hypothetical protein